VRWPAALRDQSLFVQQPIRFRKPIARQMHKEMMLGVIVHPIGRDEQPLDRIGACRAGVAERVFPGAGAGVFSNVAHTCHPRQRGYLTDSVSEPDGLLRLRSLLLGARQMRFNWERQHVSGNIRRQRVTHLPDKRLTSFIWDFGHVA